MTSVYYTITVRNFSSTTQYFHVFQKQAAFEPVVSSSSILCGSLGCQSVGNYQSSGAQISFSLNSQIYAGAVSTAAAVPPSQSKSSFATKKVQIPANSTKVVRPIELTSVNSDSATNCTILSINPLGMTQPTNQPTLTVGTFGVSVPSYTPTPNPQLYCGVAALNADGSIFLSSFIAPQPNVTMACAPDQIFFVKTGYTADGDVIPYDDTNSACCDFTTGYTRILVTYNSDGTFSTTNGS